MRAPRCLLIAAVLSAASVPGLRADEPAVTPTSPPSLRVRVSTGEWTPPGAGRPVVVSGAELDFDPPELREFTTASKVLDESQPAASAPPDYKPEWDKWDSWPDKGVLGLSPRYDDNGSLILGGLFRTFREDTLQVMPATGGGRVYRRDVDFVYHPNWGTIANKDHQIKEPVTVRVKGALQRLDLIQVATADGKVSIKKGKSLLVAPELPEPDPGCVALAGIYLAPWPAARNPHYDADPAAMKGATDYAITAKEIAVVRPLPPVLPIHPERIGRTLAKLRAAAPPAGGEPAEVRVAFMGDSVTLGAESTFWFRVTPYGEDDRTYRGRFVRALREHFPKAAVRPIEAYKGGAGIDLAVNGIDKVLADNSPDLVVIAFGANDVNSSIGGEPHTPIKKFRESLETLIDKAHAAGSEVLLVTCFPLNPFMKNGAAQRQPAYNDALKQAAEAKSAAVADVYTEYSHLGSHGIPPWSTLHNWINHPSDRGHQVYADVLLSFFPAE